MRRLIGGLMLGTTVVAGAGCRTPMMAGADYDPTVLIGQPATFAWNEPDGLPVGDPRLDNNPFFVARLHGTIARELASRGVRMAVGNRPPTLFVHHHASVQSHVEVLPSEQMSSMTPYGPGTQLYEYEEGNFLVDVIDAKTDKVVWRGWARMDLAGALDDPKVLDQLLGWAVGSMFEYFPIPVGELPALDEEPPVIEPVPDIERFPPQPDVAATTGSPFPPLLR